jgi:hypothetical protein
MDVKRFAELVHSLREAGRVVCGERKPAPLAGDAELTVLCEQVVGFFEGDVAKTALWFRLPNPMLGDISPRDMIRFGRYEKVQQFVLDALNENLQAQSSAGGGVGQGEWRGSD